METLNKKVKLEMQEEKIGVLQTDLVGERGKIIDVATDCNKFTHEDIGRTLYFKAWAVDVISIGEVKHYFISEDSDAICAIE